MKSLFLILFCVIWVGSNIGMYAQGLLKPSASFFQDKSSYYNSLLYHLTGHQEGFAPKFGLFCIPTNTPEWYLEFDDCGNKLLLTEATENIYYSEQEAFNYRKKKKKKKHIVNVRKFELEISLEQKDVLGSLFKYATAVTFKDLDDDMLTFDGVRFIFMSIFLSGECHSPKEGPAVELVDVAYKLRDIVRNKDQQALEQLMPKVKKLSGEFEKIYRKIKAVITNDITHQDISECQ